MEYMTAKEAAKKWGVTTRRVQSLCAEGRIKGTERLGKVWVIPADARKPNRLNEKR